MLRLGEARSSGSADPADPTRAGTRRPRQHSETWPEEVRELLHNLNTEANALRAERRVLSARVAELEQELAAASTDRRNLAARITDLEQQVREATEEDRNPEDHWLAEVTDRTAQTLRSGQEAAQRVVARAKYRASEIERTAMREAAEIRKRAESESEKLLLVAHYDAEGLLQGAQASGEEILAKARDLRRRILSSLEERRAALQAEIQQLEDLRLSLLKRYAGIKTFVDQAISALETDHSPSQGETLPQRLAGWWRAERARQVAAAERPEDR